MRETDFELLARYARDQAEDAFTEIVRRHLDLVHSAALRQVRSPQLAEEVAQCTFLKLARHAGELAPGTLLTAWLYQVTRREAIDLVRREARRQGREQIAAELNAMNATAADWTHLEPLLDEAMHALEATDRAALLLRYFENRSLREVGQRLGTSDDAAQKRVTRALDHLHTALTERGVTVGAGGLGLVLSAHAVQAAPAGLAATISTAAFTGTAVATSNLIATTKSIAMTTLQKSLIVVTLAAAVGVGLFEAVRSTRQGVQNHRLEQQQAVLVEQIQQLQRERDHATNRLAALAEEVARARKNPAEVMKLRGEVGALLRENQAAGEKSALNKITSDPASRKAMREQQKLGMTAIYGEFTKRLNLKPESGGEFNNLLADHVMDNIDRITQALHDRKSQAEVEQIFAAAETALQGKVQSLLGDEAAAQYQAYTQNLACTLTAAQFASTLTGDDAAKQAKQNQFRELMQSETAAALKSAGLPADFQVMPILNFANIASESAAEQNLKLLDDIYANVAARGGAFFTPAEIASFQTFRASAINNNRMALTMNRSLMAPLSK